MARIIAQTIGSSLFLASRTLSKRISCIQDSNNLWYYIIYFIEMEILVLNPNVYTFIVYIKVLGIAGKVDESWIKEGNTLSVRRGQEMWVWLELSVRGALSIEKLPTAIVLTCM